jgi:hypothetical protein
MNFQQYCEITRKLSEAKSGLYTLASHKLSKGDNAGAQKIYAQIDEIDTELAALENPQDQVATDEELTISFS